MEVRSGREDGATVIQAAGDLDVSSAPLLRAALAAALPAPGTVNGSASGSPNAIVDLTGVPFCDSVGLGVLVEAHNRARRARGRLVLVVAPGMITHLLAITNLDRHFETHPSLGAARAALIAAA
jgi:anti-sigma B factor antagonist